MCSNLSSAATQQFSWAFCSPKNWGNGIRKTAEGKLARFYRIPRQQARNWIWQISPNCLGSWHVVRPSSSRRRSIVVLHQFVVAAYTGIQRERDSVVICCYINFRWAFNNVGAQMVPTWHITSRKLSPNDDQRYQDGLFPPFGLISLPWVLQGVAKVNLQKSAWSVNTLYSHSV